MSMLKWKKKTQNRNLHAAKRNKNDEFYTQLTDIEKELSHYKDHFKDKTVLCNCDDPRVSNFFHYFSYNFEHLGLRKLIATCYKNDQVDLFSEHSKERSIYLEYEGDKNNNKVPDIGEIGIKKLKGNGDFRSDECIELLKQSDIVVTNPPFSLFREYLAQLIEYEKKFLIIGNTNATTYKEVFPLIKDNKVWWGVSPRGMNFLTPEGKESSVNVVWYTNLPHKKRNEKLILFRKYKGNEKDYPKYDNYDAIEVSKVVNIPKDYDGVMGVPITFLDKYNPEQFEVVGNGQTMANEIGIKPVGQKFVDDYYNQGNKGSINAKWNNLVYYINKKACVPYQRILIKRR